MYTSNIVVVEFVKALSTWVEESILRRHQHASYYTIMADECMDITIVEELSLFRHWDENS